MLLTPASSNLYTQQIFPRMQTRQAYGCLRDFAERDNCSCLDVDSPGLGLNPARQRLLRGSAKVVRLSLLFRRCLTRRIFKRNVRDGFGRRWFVCSLTRLSPEAEQQLPSASVMIIANMLLHF